MPKEPCNDCRVCEKACPAAKTLQTDIDTFNHAKEVGKIMIAYIAPAVRVGFSELFGKNPGEISTKKIIGLMKKIGFKYVFDLTFAADVTIMEEASELLKRLEENKNIPMFTSCCPSWVKFLENTQPDLVNHLSTTKSPVGIMGALLDTYYLDITHQEKKNTFVVGLTPCPIKKFEIKRPEVSGTDLILTLDEIKNIIELENINYEEIEEMEFDTLFPEGSGAGTLFGTTGGVMEAAIRTAYFLKTGENLKELNFTEIRGFDNLKEATIILGDKQINILVVNQMLHAKNLIEDIKNGKCRYQFIEVMSCLGGCIGGAGMLRQENDLEAKKERNKSIYQIDKNRNIRFSHENPEVIKLYKEFLKHPLSEKSEELLHFKRENIKSI